ncbi:Fic family protein [Mesorhizobium sp. ORS 3428]|uniref:Fic family protein n=1 Tax=Mesorhizobium sp. ORS 3428 TaxID=540997 RepID=UPI0009F4AD89
MLESLGFVMEFGAGQNGHSDNDWNRYRSSIWVCQPDNRRWKASTAKDPFEASFALLAGIAYLQPFIDGNKRTGRLLSNIPLLKAGLPPVSFIGVGRAAYGLGMTTWYELADTSYLGEAIAEGYAITAPSYLVATTTKRVPRSVEIRMRRRLDDAVAEYLSGAVDSPDLMPSDFARDAFRDLEGEDLDVTVQSFADVIASINELNCVAYGVTPEPCRKISHGETRGRPHTRWTVGRLHKS